VAVEELDDRVPRQLTVAEQAADNVQRDCFRVAAALYLVLLQQPEDRNGWSEALTWGDVAGDPIGFVATDYVADELTLPDGVFEANTPYPVERFSLDEKTAKKLAQLGELLHVEDPGSMTVSFRRAEVDAAEKLGAAHKSKNGYGALLVGQDIAD